MYPLLTTPLTACAVPSKNTKALGRPRASCSNAVRRACLLLGRVAAVARSARAGRTHEQLAAVGKRQVAAVRTVRPVLRLVAVHRDFRAGLQRVLREAAAQQEGERIFERAPGVGLVCGSASYHRLPQLLVQLEADEVEHSCQVIQVLATAPE